MNRWSIGLSVESLQGKMSGTTEKEEDVSKESLQDSQANAQLKAYLDEVDAEKLSVVIEPSGSKLKKIFAPKNIVVSTTSIRSP